MSIPIISAGCGHHPEFHRGGVGGYHWYNYQKSLSEAVSDCRKHLEAAQAEASVYALGCREDLIRFGGQREWTSFEAGKVRRYREAAFKASMHQDGYRHMRPSRIISTVVTERVRAGGARENVAAKKSKE